MSDIRKELAASADDAVEVLLQQAAPRLSPPIVDERLVREAGADLRIRYLDYDWSLNDLRPE